MGRHMWYVTVAAALALLVFQGEAITNPRAKVQSAGSTKPAKVSHLSLAKEP